MMPPDEALRIPDILGLKVHVCSLVAQDSASDFSWAPVCICYKLMNINDVLAVDDSASVNARIVQIDSELNIAREWEGVPKVLWHKLWGLHTSGKGLQDGSWQGFKEWQVAASDFFVVFGFARL